MNYFSLRWIYFSCLVMLGSAGCTSSKTAKEQMVTVTGYRVSSAMAEYSFEPEQEQDKFYQFRDNVTVLVADQPVSTFAAEVDTASYSYVRKRLNAGYLPNADAVRLEEMVNYFDYDYVLPTDSRKPFSAIFQVHDAPWSTTKKLMHIGIQGYEIKPETQPNSNLVFLLDVSGSMADADKLPLVQQSIELLLTSLKPTDTVSIAVYAGASGVVLPPTKVARKSSILHSLRNLRAGGSTAGAEGIQLAYQLAQENFREDAVNRIILATDGDFNVGASSPKELESLVKRKREQGVYLSVLGFGQGNYNDALMQALAQNGNGVAAYIDTLAEAQKILVHEATSSLFPIAEDLKIQVEFNPAHVHSYRLLGYETRLLEEDDFKNDKVDAGDIGSGHTVTAIYEIDLHEKRQEHRRYKSTTPPTAVDSAFAGELAFLKIRYKLPGEKISTLDSYPITRDAPEVPGLQKQEARFAAAVAGFAQLLRNDKHLGEWGYEEAIALAQENKGEDTYGYRAEFVQLIRKAKLAK